MPRRTSDARQAAPPTWRARTGARILRRCGSWLLLMCGECYVPHRGPSTDEEALIEADVLEVDRLAVDALLRRRNPVGELPALGHAARHQRLHVGVVLRARQPVMPPAVPFGFGQHVAVDADVMAGEFADLAVESLVREPQPERNARLLDEAI